MISPEIENTDDEAMLSSFARFIADTIRTRMINEWRSVSLAGSVGGAGVTAAISAFALPILPTAASAILFGAAALSRLTGSTRKFNNNSFSDESRLIYNGIDEIEKTVTDPNNVTTYLKTHVAKLDRQKATAELDANRVGSASSLFKTFLLNNGIDQSVADKIALLHDQFVNDQLPEISVLSAVKELRDQTVEVKIEPKDPYLGRRSGISPEKYLEDNYGEVIRRGYLSYGQLPNVDRGLYSALYDSLKRKNPPETVEEAFEKIKDGTKKGSAVSRRLNACSAILGTTVEQAVAFFNTVRPERIQTQARQAER